MDRKDQLMVSILGNLEELCTLLKKESKTKEDKKYFEDQLKELKKRKNIYLKKSSKKPKSKVKKNDVRRKHTRLSKNIKTR